MKPKKRHDYQSGIRRDGARVPPDKNGMVGRAAAGTGSDAGYARVWQECGDGAAVRRR